MSYDLQKCYIMTHRRSGVSLLIPQMQVKAFVEADLDPLGNIQSLSRPIPYQSFIVDMLKGFPHFFVPAYVWENGVMIRLHHHVITSSRFPLIVHDEDLEYLWPSIVGDFELAQYCLNNLPFQHETLFDRGFALFHARKMVRQKPCALTDSILRESYTNGYELK